MLTHPTAMPSEDTAVNFDISTEQKPIYLEYWEAIDTQSFVIPMVEENAFQYVGGK